jgi:hypothetical protein
MNYKSGIIAIGFYDDGRIKGSFAVNIFDTDNHSTLGVDITTKNITIENLLVTLILVETAHPNSYRGSSFQ